MPRFLACSGGGDRGIIQLGMLLEMYKKCGKEAIAYDEMAGISAGAFTCAFMSQLIPETFEREIRKLIDAFLNGNMTVIQPWTWGGPIINFINATLYHSSIYSNAKLKHLLHTWYDQQKTIVPFYVGTYNKTLAQYESFSSSCSDMEKAILASSAIPVVLPEIQIGKYHYQDGGMRHMIPVPEIKHWIQRTKGKKHIDILICYPIHNVDIFTQTTVPVVRFPIVNEATQMISNLMLEQMQNDLFDLSKILQVPVHELTKTPTFQYTREDITIRILSPTTGHYHSIASMNATRNRRLLQQGKHIVDRFLKF